MLITSFKFKYKKKNCLRLDNILNLVVGLFILKSNRVK